MMRILQISNGLVVSKVHANLYKALSEQGAIQTIYCPVRSVSQEGRYSFEAERTDVVYDNIIKPYHRYLYHVKRAVIYGSLVKKVNCRIFDLVHAATLFSDGGQAYKIYRKYHIPYVVAVRNTDINGFLDMLPNTWAAGRKILCNAEMIFFISKALMDKFANHKVIKHILPEIKDRMVLIPNGIEDYYLEHISHEPHSGHKVLYVGDFSSNKNVLRLGEAVLQLRAEAGFQDLTMTLVGGGKTNSNEVQLMIENHPDVFKFLGPIHDKDKLCEVFRSHSVFSMPSITETFGLVYIEALSQNLPVIYTKGQGIDGLFDDSVGIGVNPLSVEEIKNAIRTILESPDDFSNKTVDFEVFRWSNVAEKYMSFYKQVLDK